MISGLSESAIEASSRSFDMINKRSYITQYQIHLNRLQHQAIRRIISLHLMTELFPLMQGASRTKQNTEHPLLILTRIYHQCTAPELYSTSTPVQTAHAFNWAGFIPARSYTLSYIEFSMCWSAPIASSLGCRTLSLFRRRCPSSSPLLFSMLQLVQSAMLGQF